MEKKIVILYGLPASGKTYYAKQLSNSIIADMDKIFLKEKNEKEISKLINSKLKYCLRRSQTVVVDGLFTTNSSLRKIINEIKKIDGYEFKFSVVFWKEDREACLHNDYKRREKNSKITIKNLPFEEIDSSLFPECEIIIKEVIKKSQYEIWISENEFNSDFLCSESWCLGGTSGGYEGNICEVSPDPTPVTFEEFDKLIEKICPEINFMKYKKIYGICVRMKVHSSSDYYGGSCSYGTYECDLKKLYEMLKSEGLLK